MRSIFSEQDLYFHWTRFIFLPNKDHISTEQSSYFTEQGSYFHWTKFIYYWTRIIFPLNKLYFTEKGSHFHWTWFIFPLNKVHILLTKDHISTEQGSYFTEQGLYFLWTKDLDIHTGKSSFLFRCQMLVCSMSNLMHIVRPTCNR